MFVPADFLDLGSRTAVGLALMRHARAGRIRRLARGIYDVPRRHARLGILSPDPRVVADALARRDHARLQPTGGYAANMLGLSNQVPMKVVFLTDGPGRTVKVGTQQIILKRASLRNMATAGRDSGIVIQALRWLGRHHVDDSTVAILRHRLPADVRRKLIKDIRYAPAWIGEIMRQVAEGA